MRSTTATELLASAQESYNVALARYRAGVGSITDLLNAQSALASAQLQVIQARFRWNLAKATLAKAIGLLEPDLASASAPAPYNPPPADTTAWQDSRVISCASAPCCC